MKAVVIHAYGGPEVLTFETDVPEPVMGDDAVLVAAAATSVNPIDWKIRSGARQKDFPLQFPAILGRDVAGVVRAVGRNVRNFSPGQRVLAFASATYAELVAVHPLRSAVDRRSLRRSNRHCCDDNRRSALI